MITLDNHSTGIFPETISQKNSGNI